MSETDSDKCFCPTKMVIASMIAVAICAARMLLNTHLQHKHICSIK